MKLSLDLRTTLTQTLTPQQIQYLKLLQLPVIQLEQHVMQEVEQNPLLEVAEFEDHSQIVDLNSEPTINELDTQTQTITDDYNETSETFYESDETHKNLFNDNSDPFEFYKLVWQEDFENSGTTRHSDDDDGDGESFQIKDSVTFIEDLIQQLHLLDLTKEEIILGEHIIGNIDPDGYLRRSLLEILDDANMSITELNLELINNSSKKTTNGNNFNNNPARKFAVSSEALAVLNGKDSSEHNHNINKFSEFENSEEFYKELDLETAEKVLKQIQMLEPPGIASRTVQECLIAQCKALPKNNAAKKLALEILENAYEAFAMKHYHIILKQFEITEDYLKEALELIKRLNPKPGGTELSVGTNTVIPDFIVERDEETGELLISINDSRIPALKVSEAYEKLKKEARFKLFNKETREWIKNKYEDAKFLIQAIRQRRNTMLKVMTAIAGSQREFFDKGPSALKPMIYKNISDDTGLDISTVCRIVNNKYVMTEFGTLELKYFFSESLPNEDGEEISTTVIKQIMKEIIDSEPKDKPYSDDRIAAELKSRGYIVARRTVAKYREQLKLPVARLRKEL